MENGETPETEENPEQTTTTGAKKKRNKKKGANSTSGVPKQTNPPTIPVSQLYPDKNFPVGQILEYPPDADG